ncbi:MAG: tRNA (adenosine(37)-N6)-threonylcarbamoyltransferase complex ATPase subunit type 1 TsaE [Acidimicrobiales bacterium]
MTSAATKSADDTRALASALAGLARPGDLLLLAGELGTGKTVFAQGFARGLGIHEQVTSPTFVLARRYAGRLRLHHLDVYRLDHLQEVLDLGLAEIVDDEAVTLIEWGDVVVPAVPADFLEVRLCHGSSVDDRLLTFTAVGPAWAGRAHSLPAVLRDWPAPS